MLNSIVLILIGITALSNDSINKHAIACFLWACYIVSVIEPFIPDESFSNYYLLAALADALVIYFIKKNNDTNQSTRIIQRASYTFIYLNLFGVAAREVYIDTIYYDNLCASAYLTLLIVLNKGMFDYVGFFNKLRSNTNRFYINNYRISLQLKNNEKTQKA